MTWRSFDETPSNIRFSSQMYWSVKLIHTPLQSYKTLQCCFLSGADFWTGGLNPGLLWIWSHSATPVASNSSDANTAGSSGTTIVGEGRCLALVASHATADYLYRGQVRKLCINTFPRESSPSPKSRIYIRSINEHSLYL